MDIDSRLDAETAMVADSILADREVASVEEAALVVNVELRLSMDLFLPPSSAVATTPFTSSFRRSLETVLRRTSGEVWARPVALSMREEEEAIALSWVCPIPASERDSLDEEASICELEASTSELLIALLLRLASEEEKDFF